MENELKKTNKFIYWTPRILSIIFLFFLALMSLDVFSENLSTSETILALFMHNIPAIILLIVLLISWKYEIVGAIAYVLAGLVYIGLILYNIAIGQSEWYLLSWTIQIAVPVFLIAYLFFLNWKIKKKN